MRFESRREGRRPGASAIEGEGAVGLREAAIRPALQDDVLADAQHDEVAVAVIVDVERIEAGHLVARLVGQGVGLFLETQLAADGAAVDIEARLRRAAGDGEVGQAVAIAVEGGRAAADEIFPRAGILVVDAGGERLLDHDRHVHRQFGRCFRSVAGTGIVLRVERRDARQACQKDEKSELFHCGITNVLSQAMRALRSVSERST